MHHPYPGPSVAASHLATASDRLLRDRLLLLLQGLICLYTENGAVNHYWDADLDQPGAAVSADLHTLRIRAEG